MAVSETHWEVFPRTTRSGTLPDMKSSSEGPSSSVLLKLDLPVDEDGVASVRACAHIGATSVRDELARSKLEIRAVERAIYTCLLYVVRQVGRRQEW